MPASHRCVVCPQIVPAKGSADLLFCSDLHLMIYQLEEIRSALAHIPGTPPMEHLSITNNVSPAEDLKRSASLR